MGCRSEYMEPTSVEAYRRQTAKCYATVLQWQTGHVPAAVKSLAINPYADIDCTADLCAAITRYTAAGSWKHFAALAQDSREVRAVLDWWDNHQEVDRKRIAAEKKSDTAVLKLARESVGEIQRALACFRDGEKYTHPVHGDMRLEEVKYLLVDPLHDALTGEG